MASQGLEQFKQNDLEDFEVQLRTLSYLNQDLKHLQADDLSPETIQGSIDVAKELYEASDHTSEDKKALEDWLNVLKSSENLQSAIQSLQKELARSRIVSFAQAAHITIAPKSSGIV